MVEGMGTAEKPRRIFFYPRAALPQRSAGGRWRRGLPALKDGKRKRGMKEEEEDGGTKKQPLFLEVGPKVGWAGPRAKRKRNILRPAQKPKI